MVGFLVFIVAFALVDIVCKVRRLGPVRHSSVWSREVIAPPAFAAERQVGPFWGARITSGWRAALARWSQAGLQPRGIAKSLLGSATAAVMVSSAGTFAQEPRRQRWERALVQTICKVFAFSWTGGGVPS
jgi:hypothetical protein